MKPSISLMPRSVYLPLRHMSHSPTAQFGHGTGSGRRTMPTTRSPSRNALAVPGSMTRPSDSWPSTSRALPGGAQPYLPSTISTSVPHTPTAIASTSTDPSRGSGSGMSSRLALPGVCGRTVMAFKSILSATSVGEPKTRVANRRQIPTLTGSFVRWIVGTRKTRDPGGTRRSRRRCRRSRRRTPGP